jgi:hypothetical protein
MDVMDAISGQPAESRGGLEPRGIFEHGVRGVGDVAAVVRGGVPPTIAERDLDVEPSIYEHILTPFADVMSIARRGKIASREARFDRADVALRQQRLGLEERKNEVSIAKGWLEMVDKLSDNARELPPDRQASTLSSYADEVDKQFPGGGEILRQESKNAAAIPDSVEEWFELMPAAQVALETGGLPALQKLASDPGHILELQEALDTKRLGVLEEWAPIAEGWLRENDPEVMERIDKDGLREIGEWAEVNNSLPEDLRAPPQVLAMIERNADKLSFVNDEKMVEHAKKKREESRLSIRTSAQKEKVKATSKTDDPSTREKHRASEIRLGIAEGKEPSDDERAFLDEVARLDPLTAFRREFIFGGSPAAKREALQESLSADPEAQGWTEVEPETDREKDIVRAGLGLIIERGEGDTKERSVYLPEEEVE